MPKLATPLTDIQPRTAKPKEKPYKLTDGGGLHLLINPDGAKYWRMGYRFSGVERTLALGKYPDISLAEARKLRAAAREKSILESTHLKQNVLKRSNKLLPMPTPLKL
jgi:hypothetical protein